MSTRWMAVQYAGDTLRLPVVNEGDMDKPFGSSVLERDVKRIVVNPFSDSPQTFVPELENAKLRELVSDMYRTLDGMKDQSYSFHDVFCADVCPRFEKECVKLHADECWYEQCMHELGIEVDE